MWLFCEYLCLVNYFTSHLCYSFLMPFLKCGMLFRENTQIVWYLMTYVKYFWIGLKNFLFVRLELLEKVV